METRIVLRNGSLRYKGKYFFPCEPKDLLGIVEPGSRVLVMEDAFSEAIIVHSLSREFLCNAYVPEFWDEANKALESDGQKDGHRSA